MKLQFLLPPVLNVVFVAAAIASPVTITPISDGSLYTCDGCNTVSDGNYVGASGYIQGAIKFSTSAIPGVVTNAMLSVNPYGLPIWDSTIDIYGYGTSIAPLDITDANAGSFLGTLTLLPGLDFGQDAFFDVTSFVANTHAPYLAFNLRADEGGGVLFSSMEFNYGHPSQLIVTAVPEPSTSALLVMGVLSLGISRMVKRLFAHSV